MGGGLGSDGLPPGPVAGPAAQLGVGHARVARGDPAVDGRGLDLELAGPSLGYLGGREAAGDVGPDKRHGPLEVAPLLVRALARLGEQIVGECLGAGRGKLAPPLFRAVVTAQLAAVAGPRPRQKARARVLGAPSTRSLLPGPFATVRLRLTSSVIEAGERPRSRAMDLALCSLSSVRSIEVRSALPNLK